jgi:SLT domain-containing protein
MFGIHEAAEAIRADKRFGQVENVWVISSFAHGREKVAERGDV